MAGEGQALFGKNFPSPGTAQQDAVNGTNANPADAQKRLYVRMQQQGFGSDASSAAPPEGQK